MDNEEQHLERLEQAVLKWHEWQTANRPPLVELVGADLKGANLGSAGEISRLESTKPLGLLARVIGRVLRRAIMLYLTNTL
jgi:hypothetical protein